MSKIRNGLNEAKLPMPFPEAEQESINTVYRADDLMPEEAFAKEFIELGGKFVFCESEQEFLDNIDNLFDSFGWNEILCSEEHILQLFQNNKITFVKEADPSNSTANACITGCEALVGRTGSIIFSSRQNYGRTTPVFYPVHIVVAYSTQIVSDINEGLELMKEKYGNDLPSMINFNTGPSRTADIEKTLVVGVHGPGEVFCFYINA
ncbi:MAG TPA: LUD domain-containing protein [Flavipsychrobacter sp.]|nr:LUD domain-containing protein [Flavipsychrobacter sp.]